MYYLPNFYLGEKLWDPLLMSGFPVAADPQAMTWYPVYRLFSLFPHSWNFFVISAYVMASCFAYGFVSSVTGSRLAGFVSGIAYGMTGFMIAHLGHTSMIHAAAWLPLLIWALEKLREEFSPFWFIVACLSVAFCVLSGHLQMPAYAFVIGMFYSLFRGSSLTLGRLRYYFLSGSVFVFGIGLAAVQLVPSAELARYSLRSEMNFADFVSFSFPPFQSVSLLFPYIFGAWRESFYGIPYFGLWDVNTTIGYMGLLPLMLAAIGIIAYRRTSMMWFWLFTGLLTFLLTLGDATPLATLVYHFPGLNKFRAPTRHFMGVAFSLSVLAGLGVAAIQKRVASKGLIVKVVMAGAVVMIVSLIYIVLSSPKLQGLAAAKGFPNLKLLPWENLAVGIPLIIFVAASLSLFMWCSRPSSRLGQIFLLLILVMDLGSFGWFSDWKFGSPGKEVLMPTASQEKYRSFLSGAFQRMVSVKGVFAPKEGCPPNIARLWGIPSAGGYGPLMLSRFSQLLSIAPDGELTGIWSSTNDRGLDLMDVRYVFLPKGDVQSLAADDPKGASWSNEDMAIAIGSGCGAPMPVSSSISLPAPVRATEIGMVSAMSCSTDIPDDAEVAQILLTDVRGKTQTESIRAGRDTSEWAFDCSDVRPLMKHRRAPVFGSFPIARDSNPCEGHRYVATLPLSGPVEITKLEFRWVGPSASIGILKIRLHDKTDGKSYSVSSRENGLGDASRWRHSDDIGGISVYENLRAMPRAWLVPEVVMAKPEEILQAVKSSTMPDGRKFDPSKIALVEEPSTFKTTAGISDSSARVIYLSDKSVEMQTNSSSPAFLVLSDVYYPGWKATIDGIPTHIFQTDYLLRGVMVPSGGHIVHFSFRPRSLYIGSGITLATLGIMIVFMIAARRRHVIPQSAPQEEQE